MPKSKVELLARAMFADDDRGRVWEDWHKCVHDAYRCRARQCLRLLKEIRKSDVEE
jgi:hypothetical protein